MPVQIKLSKDQLNDLSLLRDLGSAGIKSLAMKLSAITPLPLRMSALEQAFHENLPERPQDVSNIMRLLIHLYNLRRERDLSVKDLLEGIQFGITAAMEWTEDQVKQWLSLESEIADLLSLSTIWSVVKALDLSYDYPYLLQNAKIITDIRPVFSEDASIINGAVISFTLRLYYDGIEGSQSIGLSLDENDVTRMMKACDRALKKANTAKNYMQTHDVQNAYIFGEEE